MGLPLLRDVIETVETTPKWPPFSVANDSDDFRAQLTRAVADAGRIVRKRRAVTLQIKRKIEEAAAKHANSDVDSEKLLEEIEKVRSKLQVVLDIIIFARDTSTKNIDKSITNIGKFSAEDMEFLRKRFLQYNKMLDRDIIARQNLIDLLLILSWDIDPSARGGPTFKNAEDLLANLHADGE